MQTPYCTPLSEKAMSKKPNFFKEAQPKKSGTQIKSTPVRLKIRLRGRQRAARLS